MKTISAVVALSAVAASVALGGCNATKTDSKPEASSATTSAAANAGSSSSELAVPDLPSGPHKTIADYVDENKIIEAPVSKDEPGAPIIKFGLPPDWKPAGNRKPEWAYGAIIYDKAADPADPPFITAIFNRLSGNVDPAKVLEYAPGLLQNLPGYSQDGDVKKTTLGGFDGIVFQGSYMQDDKRRYVAQKTVVIPGKDGAVFVLQLNADAPLGQDQVILDAGEVIDRDTTITVAG